MKQVVLAGTLAIAFPTGAGVAHAGNVSLSLHEAMATGPGKGAGRIELGDSRYGLLIKPDLSGLTPGPHGLHVHENPDCGPVERGGQKVPTGASGGCLNSGPARS